LLRQAQKEGVKITAAVVDVSREGILINGKTLELHLP